MKRRDALYFPHSSSSNLRPALPNKDMNLWESSTADVLGASKKSLSLGELPFDLLNTLSFYVEPADIFTGLYETDRYFHSVFSSEKYWRERTKLQLPLAYSRISGSRDVSTEDALFWRKTAYRCEGIQENFRHRRMHQVVWSSSMVDGFNEFEEDGEGEMLDFSCIAFCDYGRVLVVGDSDRYQVMYWTTTGQKKAAFPGLPERLQHTHEDVISSIKGLDHRISSSSMDGTVAITDLNHPGGNAVHCLRSSEQVLGHRWLSWVLVTGTASGSFETFDLRTGVSPTFVSPPLFDAAELFDGIEVEVSTDRQIIGAGWEDDVRKIKLLDVRTGGIITSAVVPGIVMPPPAGHWGQRMRRKACTDIRDGLFWIGAESGKVIQYDATSLELVQDMTAALGHTRHITGLHSTGSQIISISNHGRVRPELFYRTVVHKLEGTFPILWEVNADAAAGTFSAMDFCEERCALGVALTQEVQLWRPESRQRRG